MAVFTEVSADEARKLMRQLRLGELLELRGIAGGIENTNYFATTWQEGDADTPGRQAGRIKPHAGSPRCPIPNDHTVPPRANNSVNSPATRRSWPAWTDSRATREPPRNPVTPQRWCACQLRRFPTRKPRQPKTNSFNWCM